MNGVALALSLLVLAGCSHLRQRSEASGTCPATGSVASEVGATPSEMSALRNSELFTSTDVSRTWGERRTIGSAAAMLRYGGESLTGVIGGNLVVHGFEGFDLGPVQWAPANVVAGVGYRMRDSQMGGVYRRGLAIRTEVGVDIYDDDKVLAGDLSTSERRPFGLLRFTPGQYFQSMLEARYELVGCQAPFIHLELGLRGRKDIAASTLAFPFSVAIGAYPTLRTAAYARYSLLVGRAPTIYNDVEGQHRFAAGVQAERAVTWGVEAAMLVAPFTSWQLVGTVAIPLKWGADP